MPSLAYSIVIATLGRPEHVARTLDGIARQTRRPEQVILVDASKDGKTREATETFSRLLPIRHLQAAEASAAKQRNQGAAGVTTPLVAFIDDDMDLRPDMCARICEVFDNDLTERIGGISARMEGASHPQPGGLLWLYYRLQAGYSDATYGARLFGPAINCFPCYERSSAELIGADWLNSACVFYRTPMFLREKFPDFHGSSFMEDVHLSARIAKTHALYFHAAALCTHCDGAKSAPRSDEKERARMRVRNQRIVAREVMHCSGPLFEAKLLLHKIFITIAILRWRKEARWDAIAGTWLS